MFTGYTVTFFVCACAGGTATAAPPRGGPRTSLARIRLTGLGAPGGGAALPGWGGRGAAEETAAARGTEPFAATLALGLTLMSGGAPLELAGFGFFFFFS